VSGLTGLDRVNAYSPTSKKTVSIYGNCPDMINASLTGTDRKALQKHKA
jgi:hypothetical protein